MYTDAILSEDSYHEVPANNAEKILGFSEIIIQSQPCDVLGRIGLLRKYNRASASQQSDIPVVR